MKQTRSGLAIDRTAVKAAERLDGKFVVHSNDDTPSAADMALGYKQLARAEEAWRSMKSGLKLRPVFHWVPHRIHAHVAITVLALLIERVAEHACADTCVLPMVAYQSGGGAFRAQRGCAAGCTGRLPAAPFSPIRATPNSAISTSGATPIAARASRFPTTTVPSASCLGG